MYKNITAFIKELHGNQEFTPLHEPRFLGNEKKYLNECIDSTFVSSVGKYVDSFEKMCAEFCGTKYAVATVNGTAALHIALKLIGVERGDLVITQPLTFIATANAINYCGAEPLFVDVDIDTLGLSPQKLSEILESSCVLETAGCIHRKSGKRIKACVPMHTFGHPCKISELKTLCKKWQIALIEDSAESLGSYYGGKHTGGFGKVGVLSFNGNKTVTTGGGGMIITDDESLAKRAKHITTTAKVPHKWEYVHDEIGYNYRLPNINAALGVAQMEQLPRFLESKRSLAEEYQRYFEDLGVGFLKEPQGAKSNYWLNAILLESKEERDAFLEYTNNNGVMTRPIWRLISELDMYKSVPHGDLENATYLEDRVVNIPSSVRVK